MQAMLQAAPALKSCSPQVDSTVQIIHGNQNWHTGYRGVAPEYVDIRPMIAVRVLSATVFSSFSGLPSRMLLIRSVCSCTYGALSFFLSKTILPFIAYSPPNVLKVPRVPTSASDTFSAQPLIWRQ